VAKPAERLLAPGFRLVDQCLLLLGRLYQGGPLLGIGRLLVALADTPSQVCAVFRSRAMSSCTSRSSSAIACGSRPGSRGRAKEVPHLFVGGLGEVPVGLPTAKNGDGVVAQTTLSASALSSRQVDSGAAAPSHSSPGSRPWPT